MFNVPPIHNAQWMEIQAQVRSVLNQIHQTAVQSPESRRLIEASFPKIQEKLANPQNEQ